MTDATTAIAATPFVLALSPLVNAAVSGLVLGVGGLIFAGIAKLTGIAFTPDHQAQLETAADGEIQAAIANAENNLASGSFDVKSPLVSTVAATLGGDAAGLIAKLGLTPEEVRGEVVKAIGRAQMAMTALPAPAPPPSNLALRPVLVSGASGQHSSRCSLRRLAHTAQETVTIKTGNPMVAIVYDGLVPLDLPSGNSFEVDNIGVHPVHLFVDQRTITIEGQSGISLASRPSSASVVADPGEASVVNIWATERAPMAE